MSNEKSELTKLDKVLILLGLKEETQEEITLVEKTLEDGTIISYENLEVGTPVFVMAEGEEPIPLPDGEYQISDTETLVVTEGVITEVMVAETEPTDEEMAESVNLDTEGTGTPKNADDVFNMDNLKKMISLDKDGFHTITFSIANGKIEWGNIYSESFQELKLHSKEADTKLQKLEKEIEDMKKSHKEQLKSVGETLKSSGLIQAPVEMMNSEPKTWKEKRLESLKTKAQTV